jgi:hypothetical protein
VPYQLQALAQLLDTAELLELVFTALDVLVATLVATLDEVLLVAELVEVAVRDEVARLLELAVPQRLPVIVGASTAPPFFAPWKPNSTVWPTAILPFHPRLEAV